MVDDKEFFVPEEEMPNMKEKVEAEDNIVQDDQKEQQKLDKELEKERKREEKKEQEYAEKRRHKETRTKEKRERNRREIERQDQESIDKISRELDIESVKPKELKLKKMKQEKDINLIPSKRQFGTMINEAKIGFKEDLSKASYKLKSRMALLPETTKKLAMSGVKAGITGLKKKIEDEQAYRQKIIATRQRAKFYAQKKKIYKEELMKVGFGRKNLRPQQQTTPTRSRMTLFTPRQPQQDQQRTGLPLFQPRQNVGFEKKVVNTLPLMQKRDNSMLTLRKSDNSALSIGKSNSKSMTLFNFKKRDKK